MPHVSHVSLRSRLIAAVVLTTLPLMVLIWDGAQREFTRESLALEQEVQRLTASVAEDVDLWIEATRQILIAVAGIERAADPRASPAIVADLAAQCPYYRTFGILSPTGAPSLAVPAAAAEPIDPRLVRRAAATNGVVVGQFRAGASGGKDLLSVAYRVGGASNGRPPQVAFAVLDLDWLEALLARARVTGRRSLFPSGMILNILDRSGTILTRYPDEERWARRKIPDTAVLNAIIEKGAGSAELIDVDGVRRWYGFQSVQAASGDLFVCIGVARREALAAARRDMRRNLAAVSAIGLLLILAAWFGTGLFIVRPLASLVTATERVGAGDLAARTGVTRGPREVTHLAGAFDRMADALQRSAREREQLQTKLVQYDHQLRSMSVEAALVEERERKQIAAGLHDKAGPLLATCYMKLGRALKRPAPEEVAAVLRECRELIDQAVGDLRSLTFDLSSPTLYTLGLPAAVEELCREMEKHHALELVFRDQGTPADLANDQRVVLYRAARELLLNVVKHAEATRVTAICGEDAEGVFLSVADNGVGFDAADAGRGFSRTGGFGLFNLRERVEHLGGRFAVESSRGSGTRVVVTLPVRAREGQEEEQDGD